MRRYRASTPRRCTGSRGMAEQIALGERARGIADEYATWAELEAVQRENEMASCSLGRFSHRDAPRPYQPKTKCCAFDDWAVQKVQIGFQSLNDHVLALNKRGHDVAATRRAVKLLRKAGFKIHAHWMPNLYGSSPEADRADFTTSSSATRTFVRDELKIYPCSLIESAELMQAV